jgi:hypothetical protein
MIAIPPPIAELLEQFLTRKVLPPIHRTNSRNKRSMCIGCISWNETDKGIICYDSTADFGCALILRTLIGAFSSRRRKTLWDINPLLLKLTGSWLPGEGP